MLRLDRGPGSRRTLAQAAKLCFEQMREPGVKARPGNVPARFKPPREDVDPLISSAGLRRQNSNYKEIIATFPSF